MKNSFNPRAIFCNRKFCPLRIYNIQRYLVLNLEYKFCYNLIIGNVLLLKICYVFRELASEKQCPMVYVECSSYFTAKAAERLGFQCIYTLNFRDYVDENGEIIFKTPPPHDSSKVYVLML